MPHLKDRYVFLHIPKTAGTSLRTLLGEVFGVEAVSPAAPIRPIGRDEARLLEPYAVVAEHISWSDVAAFFSERHVFTYLRDPVDRCPSVYGYYRRLTHLPLIPLDQIRGLNDAAEAISLARQLDPEDFFRSDHPHLRQNLDNRMVWQLGYRAAVERRDAIRPGDVLGMARGNLAKACFIGFFENLARDAERLRRLLTGDSRSEFVLPQLNRTIDPLRISDVGASTRKAIERLTEMDRELYDDALKLAEADRRSGERASWISKVFRNRGRRSSI